MHTTNDASAFIAVAEDCPVDVGTEPPVKVPATVARMQYEMLEDAPYRYTSDEVVFGVHAARSGVPTAEMDAARSTFFSKGQPCLRSSPLARAYGWGFHFDAVEQAFRDLDALGGELTPEAVAIVGRRYSVDVDFEGTGPVLERHELSM